MRTKAPLAIVFAMALAAAFFAGSGFNALVDGDRSVEQIERSVQDEANDSAASDGEIRSNRRGTEDGSIVDLVISGAGSLGSILGLVLRLPFWLRELGFPSWFAMPVGAVLQLVVTIGILQFTLGRVYR